MKLRPHQEKAVEMLKASFQSGHKRPIVAAPCAFGKTHLAAYLMKGCQDKGNRGLFICDRIKLVDQTLDAFRDWDIWTGVLQSDHPDTDYAAPIQVASAQTLSIRMKNGYDPDPQLIIVDECHTVYKGVQKILDTYPQAKIIGLSATPYSKGLGLTYDDLLIPATTEELLEQGYLTPITYYGGKHINTAALRTRSIKTGGSDFDPKHLEKRTNENKDMLTGSIIENWIKYGENRQTIAFSPSIAHSKYLVKMFKANGIPAAHIDGYTDISRRLKLYKQHDEGKIKILSCSQLLTAGFDSPTTSCMIDCTPTFSKIQFQQRAGRIMRIAPGKEYAVYLDHSGNVGKRHGLVEWMIPSELSTNEKKFAEKNQLKEKKEKEPNECPECHRIMTGIKCICGFEFEIKKELTSTQEMLVRISGKKATPEDREYMGKFYSSLLKLSRDWGFKDGWAAWKYKERFGIWPRSIDINTSQPVLPEAKAWADAALIKYAKRRKANDDNEGKMVEVAQEESSRI
jgi:superfamily II DNA or RNA helicase